jgi:hypothetical protein
MAPFLTPLPGYLPRGSGWWYGAPRSGGYEHAGLDLLAPVGVPVHAMASAKVAQAGQGTEAAGWAVTLAHAFGWSTFYCHLSRVDVTVGALVEPGDVLGLSGGAPGAPGAGNSAAPHLHLATRLAGRPYDPVPLIAWPEHRGAAALWLQGRLLAHGFDPGTLDGIAGPATLVALGAFQAAAGLPVTWAVDYRTRPRLAKAPR